LTFRCYIDRYITTISSSLFFTTKSQQICLKMGKLKSGWEYIAWIIHIVWSLQMPKKTTGRKFESKYEDCNSMLPFDNLTMYIPLSTHNHNNSSIHVPFRCYNYNYYVFYNLLYSRTKLVLLIVPH
jgi:hypothetical protein